MGINAVSKAIFKQNRDIIITWFSVLTRGPNAFRELDLEENSTLIYALRFMFYMAFADVIVSVPLIGGMGWKANDTMLVTLTIGETFVEYLAIALILHVSMKVFGGRGRIQGCVAGYCLLTAYFPIITVLMIPAKRVFDPLIAKSSSYPDVVIQAFAKFQQLSKWDRVSLEFSYLATTAVWTPSPYSLAPATE